MVILRPLCRPREAALHRSRPGEGRSRLWLRSPMSYQEMGRPMERQEGAWTEALRKDWT